MVDFALMFSNLEGMGFYTFVLPWVLFLVIIYSIVTKAPFLKNIGGQSRQISVIIAAILSFYIVNYEWDGQFVGDYLTEMFGASSLYIVGFLVLILFLGMGGWKVNSVFGGKWIPIVMVLVAVMIFFNTGSAAQFEVDDETMTWLFMLALVGGALYFLNSEPAKKKDDTQEEHTDHAAEREKQKEREKAQHEAVKRATSEAENDKGQPPQPTEEQKKEIVLRKLAEKVGELFSKKKIPEKMRDGVVQMVNDSNISFDERISKLNKIIARFDK